MAERKNSLFPSLRMVLVAGLAGALAGAVAVYVTSRIAGNTGEGVQDVQVAEADVAACAAKTERAATVAAAAVGEVAAMMASDPPQSVKALAFNDPDGNPMTIADHGGKTVLLNLWATWCAPCREEMPALNTLQKDMGSDDFEVLAINVDTGDDTKPLKFLAETDIDTLGYYRDNTLGIFNELKRRGLALGLPVTLLIDGEGCLLAHMNGPAEWAGADAKKLVAVATGD